jgi:hypothetical protein
MAHAKTRWVGDVRNLPYNTGPFHLPFFVADTNTAGRGWRYGKTAHIAKAEMAQQGVRVGSNKTLLQCAIPRQKTVERPQSSLGKARIVQCSSGIMRP